MQSFRYNDMEFEVEQAGNAWDIAYKLPSGSHTLVAAGLFPGLAAGEAQARAKALVKTIFPVGIKIIGPDVAHPNTIGDLKIVGPDVAHPNFIYWDKDSSSLPRMR